MSITAQQHVASFSSKENHVGYDHAAAATTRFVQSTHSPVLLDWRGLIGDCSGGVIGSAVTIGWPRYSGGFPESSGDMARFIVEHRPELLLWSWDGKGKFKNQDDALAIEGVCWTCGKFENGDNGHTGLSKGKRAVMPRSGWKTIESSSGLQGIKEGWTGRFTGAHAITHVFMIPGVDYGAHTPDIPEEDLMAKSAFFAHTDEPVDRPGAPGQGPGAVWWLINPDTGNRIHVVSVAHRDWLAAICPVRPGANGQPDKSVIATPASWLYQFNHATAA